MAASKDSVPENLKNFTLYEKIGSDMIRNYAVKMLCSKDMINQWMSKIPAKTEDKQSIDWIQKLNKFNKTVQPLRVISSNLDCRSEWKFTWA